jgi:hydrogenase maturation protease
VYVLQPSGSPMEAQTALDPHAMDPMHLMAMARSLGEISAEMFIVGCEPQDFGDGLEGRMALSDVVASAVPEAARAVLDVIHSRVSSKEPSTASQFCAV